MVSAPMINTVEIANWNTTKPGGDTYQTWNDKSFLENLEAIGEDFRNGGIKSNNQTMCAMCKLNV